MTSKGGLSYVEAMESERKAVMMVEPAIPTVWIKPLLEIVHLNKGSLGEVVDLVYDYFRGTRFESEAVFVDIPSSGVERTVEKAIIIEKLTNDVEITLEKKEGDKRQMQREAKEALEDSRNVPVDLYHYRIQLQSNHKVFVVSPSQMRRPRQVLSKNTFKRYIKEVARKDKVKWVVKGALCEKYDLVHVEEENVVMKGPKKGVKEVEDTLLEDLKLEKPVICTDYHGVEQVSELIQVYHFLTLYGKALDLYPVTLEGFIKSLSGGSSDYQSQAFGALLNISCFEYQNRIDIHGRNSHFVGLPLTSEDTEEKESIERYVGFSGQEKVSVDQWFKWRKYQWGEPSMKDYREYIKAWPLALYGLVKDCLPNTESLKFKVMSKLASTTNDAISESVQEVEEVEEEEEEVVADEGKVAIGSREIQIDMILNGPRKRKKVDLTLKKVQPKQKDSKSILKAQMRLEKKRKFDLGFYDLCARMELGFWDTTSNERLTLLSFLINNFVQDSDFIRTHIDASIELLTTLNKTVKKKSEETDSEEEEDDLEGRLLELNGRVRGGMLGEDKAFNRFFSLDLEHGNTLPYTTGFLLIETLPSLNPVNELQDRRLLEGTWGYLKSPEDFEMLLSSLDTRGIREERLARNMDSYKNFIKGGMRARESGEVGDYENLWLVHPF